MLEVREGLHRRLYRYFGVCRMDTTHGGGEVRARYLSGAVMTSFKSGATLVGDHVYNQRAGGIGVSTVKERYASLGAAHDPQGMKYWLVGRGKALTTKSFVRNVCHSTEVPKQLCPY
jgi:hypothetical protein